MVWQAKVRSTTICPTNNKMPLKNILASTLSPHMLIDKEGNIMNREAPRPYMSDDLLNAVYKLLEK